MNTIDRAVAQLAGGLLDASLKAFFVMLAACAIVLLLRRRSAAMRHMVWTLAVAAVLTLPVFSLLMPRWRIPVLPAQVKAQAVPVSPAEEPAVARIAPQGVALPAASELRVSPAPVTTESPHDADYQFPPAPSSHAQVREHVLAATAKPAASIPPATSPHRPIRLTLLLLLVWALGAAVAGLVRLVGIVAVRINSYRAVSDPASSLSRLMRQLAGEVAIRRSVSLLLSGTRTMPMTWGVLRPRVMLPASATQWPLDRTKTVLLHELSHVRRWDCLTLGLAHLACMLYWFNPLAWLAQARMRCEQERACDDAVLAYGAVATSYARDLLLVARTLRADPLTSLAAVTMARRSQLRGRILAILDSRVSRCRVTRRTVIVAAIVAAATLLPLSALRLAPRQPLAKADAVAPATRPARTLDLVITDSNTNQPLSDVEVEAHFSNGDWKGKSGSDGHTRVGLPENVASVSVHLAKAHYVKMWAVWLPRPNLEPEPVPASYAIAMSPGTHFGGRIVDDAGNPVAGAHVALWMTKKFSDSHLRLDTIADDIVSGADGTWSFDRGPSDDATVQAAVWHYNYANGETYKLQKIEPTSKLRDASLTLTLKRGVPVEGVVLGIDGKPLAGAQVRFGGVLASNIIPPEVTKDDGRFAYATLPGDQVVLTVKAKGCAPELKRFLMSERRQEVSIQLSGAKTLSGRVIDSKGQAVPFAYIFPDTWRGSRSLETRLKADKDGRFSWTEAPADTVYCDVGGDGFIRQQQVPLTASEHEVTITLVRALHVHGTVVDAETNQPIDTFTVVPGALFSESQPILWDRARTRRESHGGKFDYVETWERAGFAVRIEASGYLPAESRTFRQSEGDVALEFKLKRGKDLTGTVVTADGKSAIGAKIYLVLAGQTVQLSDGKILHPSPNVEIGADGRFTFPPQSGKYLLVVLHDRYFGQFDSIPTSGTLTVAPWARVEGTLMTGSKPAPGGKVDVRPAGWPPPRDRDRSVPGLIHNLSGTADEQGHFVLEHVPPGDITVSRAIWQPTGGGAFMVHFADSQKATIRPGQTLAVIIGGGGRTVLGRILVPPRVAQQQDWSWGMGMAMLKIARPAPPPLPDELKNATVEQRRKWMADFLKTDAGKKYQEEARKAQDQYRSYPVELKQDGSFHIDGVMPGTYDIAVSISRKTGPSTCGPGDTIVSSARTEFTMPPISDTLKDQPLEIADVPMTMLKTVVSGDQAPAFSVKTLDGKDLKLADFSGKYVLLDFWASWCAPCLAETPHIKAAYDAFASDSRFAMISLSFDHAPADADKYAKQNGMTWPQVFLPAGFDDGIAKAYAIRGIPSIWLIGPDGKVLAKDLRGNSIKAAIQAALPPVKNQGVGAAPAEQVLTLDLLAVDAKAHTPIRGANVDVGAFVIGSSKKWTGTTDQDGRYPIRIPGPVPGSVRVGVQAAGYAPRAIQWPLTWGKSGLPAAFTMELQKGEAIGGVVQDEQGKPVIGATVSFIVPSQKISEPYGTWQYAKTDAQGRWKIDDAPADLHGMILELDHPQHPHSTINDPPPPDRFRDKTAVVVINTGATVTGVVIDNAGKPIREATVTAGEFHGASDPIVKAADDGSFALHVDGGSRVLTVWAAGFAPQTRKLAVATGMVPVQFTLLHGHELRGRVLDIRGSPLDGARIYLMHWGDNERLEWNAQTDGNGRFVWADAPGEQVTLSFMKEGFMSKEALLSPDAAEQLVTLSPQLHVRGTVTDAQSGKLVQDFEIVDGYQPGGSTIIWETMLPPQTFRQSGGKFDHPVRPGPYSGYAVRVIVPGYGAQESRVLKPDEGQVTIDFKLLRTTGTEGVVRMPNGSSASGTEIYAVLPGSPTFFRNGRLNETFPRLRVRELSRQTTRADGTFSFPADTDPQAMYIVLHDSGYAIVTHSDLLSSGLVKLTAWGVVEGTLWSDGKPDAAKQVMLQPLARPQGTTFTYDAVTDAGGHFRFERVMAGGHTVARGQPSDGPWLNPAGAGAQLDVQPGETAHVDLGRTGRMIVGRLIAPKDVAAQDLAQTTLVVQELPPRLPLLIPPMPPHVFVGIVNTDGSFRVPDVLAGRHSISATVMGSRSRLADRGIRGSKEIEVPLSGSGTVDVGEVPLVGH